MAPIWTIFRKGHGLRAVGHVLGGLDLGAASEYGVVGFKE